MRNYPPLAGWTGHSSILTCSLLFHRKELELRLLPGGSDFREAVSKEVASVEQKHSHRRAELEEKLAEGRKQYAALEDEFRMALIIEAARFSEVWHWRVVLLNLTYTVFKVHLGNNTCVWRVKGLNHNWPQSRGTLWYFFSVIVKAQVESE